MAAQSRPESDSVFREESENDERDASEQPSSHSGLMQQDRQMAAEASNIRDMSPSPLPSISSSISGPFGGSRTSTPAMDQTLTAAFRDRIRTRVKTNTVRAKFRSLREEDENTSAILAQQDSESLVRSLLERRDARLRWKASFKQVVSSVDSSQEEDDRSARRSSAFEKQFSLIRDEAYEFATRTSWPPDDEQGTKETSGGREKEEDADQEETQRRASVNEILSETTDGKISVMVREAKVRQWADKSDLFLYSPNARDSLLQAGGTEGGTLVPPTLTEEDLEREPILIRLLREGQNLYKWFLSKDDVQMKKIHKLHRTGSDLNLDNDYSDGAQPLTKASSPVPIHRLALSKQAGDNDCSIHLVGIYFEDHPLATEELILASQLRESFGRFDSLARSQTIVDLKKQEEDLLAEIKALQSASPISRANAKRNKLTKETVTISREKNRQIVLMRNALLSMLNFWEAIEVLRTRQGFISSDVHLRYAEQTDVKIREEEKLHSTHIKERIQIEIWAAEEVRQNLQEEYRKDLRRWKQAQRLKTHDPARGDGDVVIPSKPEPPSESEKVMRHLTEEIRSDTFLMDGRLPGEPKLVNVTIESRPEQMTATDECPEDERRRRAEVHRRYYSLKFYTNGHLICKTRPVKLRPGSLQVQLSGEEAFTLPTTSSSDFYTNEIIVKLFERMDKTTGGKLDGKRRRIAKLYSPPLHMDFASMLHNRTDHSDQLKEEKSLEFNDSFLNWGSYSGTIRLFASSANMKNNSQAIGPLIEGLEENLESLPNDEARLEVIRQLISHVSPADEEMDDVLKSLKELKVEDPQELDDFKLEPIMALHEFVKPEEIWKNRRFQLLKLRSNGHPAFKNIKMVPLEERFIPKNFIPMKISAHEIDQVEFQRDASSMDYRKRLIQEKRAKIVEILLQSRERSTTPDQIIPSLAADVETPRQWEDVIFEYEPPDDGTNALYLLAMIKSSRPLHPTRREWKRKAMKAAAESTTNVQRSPTHIISQFP